MDVKKINSGVLLRFGVGLAIVALSFFLKRNWLGSLLLGVGWIIGDLMSEIDQLFYVAMCNPQELTCQRVRSEIEKREWRNAWGILKSTTGERTRLPIHNMLTAMVVAVLGVWIVSSAGSILASGVVVGLGTKLFVEFLFGDKKSWFWIFTREFSIGEIRVVGGVWGLLLLISLIGLVR